MKRGIFLLCLFFTLSLGSLVGVEQGALLSFDDSFQNQFFATELKAAFTKSVAELFSWRTSATGAECSIEIRELEVVERLYATCTFRLVCNEREMERTVVIAPLVKRQLSSQLLEQLQYDVAHFLAPNASEEQIDYTLRGSFSTLVKSADFTQSTLVSVVGEQQQIIGLLRVTARHKQLEEPLIETQRIWAQQKLVAGMPLVVKPNSWRWQVLLGSSLEQLDVGVRFSKYLKSYPFTFATSVKSSLPYSLMTGQIGFDFRLLAELGVHVPLSFIFGFNGKSLSDFALTGAVGAGVGGAQLATGTGAFIYGAQVGVGLEWHFNLGLTLAVEFSYRQWAAIQGVNVVNYDSTRNKMALAFVVGFAW